MYIADKERKCVGIMSFTSRDYEAVLERFRLLADEKYKKFNESLMPGTVTSYGVRMPRMREIAMEIVRQDAYGFLAVSRTDSTEEVQLRGLVISGMKVPLAEKLPLLRDFIPLIDNWGVCDTVSIKAAQGASGDVQLLWDFLSDYFDSDKEFFIRFAVVTGMSNFIVPEYIDEYLARLTAISHEGYYVRIGVAWAVCECFVKFRDKTLPVFETKILDKQTQNKAIQKCRESFRVTDEDKEYLRSLKI
jgi:3-methyladenine DNA glycosylase AlkD